MTTTTPKEPDSTGCNHESNRVESPKGEALATPHCSLRVFRMNDCDWWVAPTLEDVVNDYRCEMGLAEGDEWMWEEAEGLSERDLDMVKEHATVVYRFGVKTAPQLCDLPIVFFFCSPLAYQAMVYATRIMKHVSLRDNAILGDKAYRMGYSAALMDTFLSTVDR